MILTILKIIGIILLVILLLIIFILAVVMLCPIRYRFNAEYFDSPDVFAVVRFLPVGLNAQVTFKENDLNYTVRALGGVIMTNTDAKLSWIGRKISGGADTGVGENTGGNDTSLTSDSNDVVNQNIDDISNSDVSSVDYNNNPESEDNSINTEGVDNSIDTFNIKDSINDNGKKKTKKIKKSGKIKDKRPLSEKIEDKTAKLKRKYAEICNKIKKLNKKKDSLLKVLKSERFEKAKRDVFRYIKELLKALKPKHIDGRIHFGLDDPATTGEIVGGLATFLPLYDGIIDIRPDFEKQIIEGIIKGYGKFRIISFVKVGIKVIFNRNLMKVIKRVQTILEV